MKLAIGGLTDRASGAGSVSYFTEALSVGGAVGSILDWNCLGFGFGIRRTTWQSRSESTSLCPCPSNLKLRVTNKGRYTLRTTASELTDDVLNVFDRHRLNNTRVNQRGSGI